LWIAFSSDTDKKLENRTFWSIIYMPRHMAVMGHRLIVFIDAITGEIIDVVSGI
jgi:hypothetical protein